MTRTLFLSRSLPSFGFFLATTFATALTLLLLLAFLPLQSFASNAPSASSPWFLPSERVDTYKRLCEDPYLAGKRDRKSPSLADGQSTARITPVGVHNIVRGDKLRGFTRMAKNTMLEFELEVITIAQQSPNRPSILAEITTSELLETGVLSGMSGSPVYRDGQLVGAVAFTVPNLKKPIVGITPFEQMQQLAGYIALDRDSVVEGDERASSNGGARSINSRASQKTHKKVPNEAPRETPKEASNAPLPKNPSISHRGHSAHQARTRSGNPPAIFSGLKPMSLAISGLPLEAGVFLEKITAHRPSHLTPSALYEKKNGRHFPAKINNALMGMSNPANSLSSPLAAEDASQYPFGQEEYERIGAELIPGDLVGINLMRGDMDVSAYGTVTAVEGNIVYAFGHQFENGGLTTLPFFKAYVDGVVPRTDVSYKIGSRIKEIGVLCQDRSAGIAAVLGKSAPMIPLQLKLDTEQNKQQFAFSVVDHPGITPTMAAMAAYSSFSSYEGTGAKGIVGYELEVLLEDISDTSGAPPKPKEAMSAKADAKNNRNNNTEQDTTAKRSFGNSGSLDKSTATWTDSPEVLRYTNTLPYARLGEGAFALAGIVYSLLETAYANPYEELAARAVNITIKNAEQSFAALVGVSTEKAQFDYGEPIPITLKLRRYLGELEEEEVLFSPTVPLMPGTHTLEIMSEADFISSEVLITPERYRAYDIRSLLKRLKLDPKRDKLVVVSRTGLGDLKMDTDVYEKIPFIKGVQLGRINQSGRAVLPKRAFQTFPLARQISGNARITVNIENE